MKNIFRIFVIAAVVSFAAGCGKESGVTETATPVQPTGRTSLTVTLPDAEKTDLVYDNYAYKAIWDEGDVIYVNGVASDPLPAAQAGTNSAEFSVPATVSAPYNVLYCGVAGEPDVVMFKSSVKPEEGRLIGKEESPMYASSDYISDFLLLPLGSFLKLSLSGESNQELRSITFTCLGEEKISGKFTAGKSFGVYDGSISGGTGSTISVEAEGIALASEPKSFYVPVPAGNYYSGFSIVVNLADGGVMKLTSGTNGGVEILPGKVYEFPAKTFVANSDEVILATPADLVAFAQQYAGSSNAGCKVKILNDIDMTGVAYPSVSFYGSLDGGNHTISGLTTSLFNELFGNVKDLTLDSEVSYSTGGQDYGMGLLAHYAKIDASQPDPFIKNVTTKGKLVLDCSFTHAFQAGGVIGASNGVSITDCTNYADVIVNSMTISSGTLYVGGCAGVCQTSAIDAKGNVNYGKVSCVQADVAGNTAFGGVFGCLNAADDATGSINYGEVNVNKVSTAASLYLGGVAGYTAKSGVILKTCENRGAIISGTGNTVTSYCYCGGISGYSFAVVNDCTNYGDITIEGEFKQNSTFGGLVGRNANSLSGKVIDGTNNGNLYFGEGFKSTKQIYAGGLIGHVQSGNVAGTNNGNITIDKGLAKVSNFLVGGIAGQSVGNFIGTASKPVLNTGNLTINNPASTSGPYVGGIVGYWYSSVTTGAYSIEYARNEGKISVTKDITSTSDIYTNLRLGGIVAYLPGYTENNTCTHTISSCSNAGEISLTENCTAAAICKYPSAGGILAISYAQTGKRANITISDCSNSGNITRLNKGADGVIKSKITEDASTTISFAGGIFGANGLFTGGDNANCYAKYLVENCINSGNIRFNAWRSKGARAESSGQGTMCYTGGIVGFSWGYNNGDSSVTAEIRCCTNSGILNSNYGKNGGICGFVRGYTLVTGKKVGSEITYTTNTGGVMYDSTSDTYTAENCIAGYAGGIAGYIYGDGQSVLRYCYNNGGRTLGNYGAGGLVGQMCSSGAATSPTIEYCKINAKSGASSGAKAYGLFAGQAAGLDWSKINNVAVGGAYKGSTATSFTYPTAETFSDFLVKNNSTDTQVAAAKQAVTDGRLIFWDTTSATSWE